MVISMALPVASFDPVRVSSGERGGTGVARDEPIMIPNCGALAALGLFTLIAYLFWRGTIVVVNAHELVERGALLLDAGTRLEFTAAHIAGSVNIPARDIAQRQAEIGPRNRSVVVYARSGFRSAQAAQALRGMGYSAVTNAGPMRRWNVL
jgi:rhodanese-related sulfurtransferase